jgi:hypothetical protein
MFVFLMIEEKNNTISQSTLSSRIVRSKPLVRNNKAQDLMWLHT